jgi:SAM-dependent methyltransferase
MNASIYSARAYWDAAADTYHQDFADTLIGRAQRECIWREIEQVFTPGQRIVELNCGTGVDAVFLANRGVRVLACDIAPRMIEQAQSRADLMKLSGLIDFRVLATERIELLEQDGTFDGAFSNFSGLNCVDDLQTVARKLALLLRPGARLVLCIIGRFVPWEIAWYLAHGNPRKAFRRFERFSLGRFGDNAVVKVHYPSVQKLVRMFAPDFRLRRLQGIGITLPPTYLESFAHRFPSLLNRMARLDRLIGTLPIVRSMGDCVLLQFDRTER